MKHYGLVTFGREKLASRAQGLRFPTTSDASGQTVRHTQCLVDSSRWLSLNLKRFLVGTASLILKCAALEEGLSTGVIILLG